MLWMVYPEPRQLFILQFENPLYCQLTKNHASQAIVGCGRHAIALLRMHGGHEQQAQNEKVGFHIKVAQLRPSGSCQWPGPLPLQWRLTFNGSGFNLY
jgi:hypothetical protein